MTGVTVRLYTLPREGMPSGPQSQATWGLGHRPRRTAPASPQAAPARELD
jgi:hypothetical protein